MTRPTEIRLGQLLIQKRLCSLRQVNEALLRQKKIRHKKQNVPLGKILVEIGWLDPDSLREALAEMGVLSLYCPACQVEYPVRKYVRNSVYTCPRCKQPLSVLDVAPTEKRPEGLELDVLPTDEPTQVQPVPGLPPPAPAAARSPAPSTAPPRAGDSGGAGGDADEHVGKVLGGCQLVERIGRGGMGMVYRARQLNLGRTVAVKILSADLASDAGFRRRFSEEARSAAQLSHGNIVQMYNAGEYQGIVYFIMEYVDGQNLRELLRTTPQLDVDRAVEIAIQVCHALRHAHSRGIIHRDIKPENIMLTQDGVVKLADLGLAKRVASEQACSLTQDGAILGTPYYMAPEQATDFSRADRRSDIYSLGVTLYRMITGKVPFEGRTPIEVMMKALEGKRVPVREFNPNVPPELEKVVDRMMQKSPDRRYPEVDEVLRDLVPLVTHWTVPTRA